MNSPARRQYRDRPLVWGNKKHKFRRRENKKTQSRHLLKTSAVVLEVVVAVAVTAVGASQKNGNPGRRKKKLSGWNRRHRPAKPIPSSAAAAAREAPSHRLAKLIPSSAASLSAAGEDNKPDGTGEGRRLRRSVSPPPPTTTEQRSCFAAPPPNQNEDEAVRPGPAAAGRGHRPEVRRGFEHEIHRHKTYLILSPPL